MSQFSATGGYQQMGRGQSDIMRGRRGPKNYTRSDERLRELICERLLQEQAVDVSNVSVEVKDGRVTLEGTVPERQMRHVIEDTVDCCWGVEDIENHIGIQSSSQGKQGQQDTEMSGGGQQQSRVSAGSGGLSGLASSSGSSTAGGKSSGGGEQQKGRSKEE
jgi:hypothetical protein